MLPHLIPPSTCAMRASRHLWCSHRILSCSNSHYLCPLNKWHHQLLDLIHEASFCLLSIQVFAGCSLGLCSAPQCTRKAWAEHAHAHNVILTFPGYVISAIFIIFLSLNFFIYKMCLIRATYGLRGLSDLSYRRCVTVYYTEEKSKSFVLWHSLLLPTFPSHLLIFQRFSWLLLSTGSQYFLLYKPSVATQFFTHSGFKLHVLLWATSIIVIRVQNCITSFWNVWISSVWVYILMCTHTPCLWLQGSNWGLCIY